VTATPRHIPALTTERLTLRPPVGADLAAYLAFYAASDTAVGKYRRRQDQAEIAAILADDIAHWQAKGFGMWLMARTGEDAVIGGAGIVHPDGWPFHELTWWLMPAVRGVGFATEASRAVLHWAGAVLGWPVVETHFRDENVSARRLATRLGGTFDRRHTFPDGVSRDVFVFDGRALA